MAKYFRELLRYIPGVRKLADYGLATAGPVGVAGSQFVLSLSMLHAMSPSQFGAFSFLLLTVQLGCGFWSALFCAPLPIVAGSPTGSEREALLKSIVSANFFCAALAFFILLCAGAAMGIPHAVSALFALYGMLTLLRWFTRQFNYLTGGVAKTLYSDLVFAVVSVCGVIAFHVSKTSPLQTASVVLVAATAASFAPFGRGYLLEQLSSASMKSLSGYGAVWRRYARWSLIGIITTEATGNAHAYLVTFFCGASAFAPLYASALLMRPVGLAMMALSDFERPALARQIQNGEFAAARRTLSLFRIALLLAFGLTIVAGVVVTVYTPHLIFPAHYAIDQLRDATAIWMAVFAVRVLRTPESALLQAGGVFRPLARASTISCGVSIAFVCIFLVLAGPIWSIVGVLMGEAVFAVWIHRAVLFWSKTARANPVRGELRPEIKAI